MNTAISPVQGTNAQQETQQSALAAKNPQTNNQAATPQDKVTISSQAQQALAAKGNPGGGQ